MLLRRSLLLLGLALPQAATAQGPYLPPNPTELPAGDLRKLSPARVVSSERKALKLEPIQVARLDSIAAAFDDSTERFARNVKRLQRVIHPRGPARVLSLNGLAVGVYDAIEGRKDSADRAREDSVVNARWDKQDMEISAARRELGDRMLVFLVAYEANREATIAVLTGEQFTKIIAKLEDAHYDLKMRIRRANVR